MAIFTSFVRPTRGISSARAGGNLSLEEVEVEDEGFGWLDCLLATVIAVASRCTVSDGLG
jgi:hypothetical protein